MTERELLRRAVESEPVPRDLHARVRTRLEARYRPAAWLFGAAAICAGFLFAFTQVYAISVLRIGLADHLHCALESRFPRQSDRSEMTAALGSQFAPLIQPIVQHDTGNFRLISAHQCSVGNRQYVHFVFQGADGLTSVSLTKRRLLDWIPWKQNRRLDGYSVAGFQDDDFLVFVSSQNPKQELTDMFEQVLVYRL